MSTVQNTKIVTNGLVLYLDAANPNSYISGTVNWNDLITSYTGSLVNGVGFSSSYGGYLAFDGVNDYFEMDPITSGSDTGTYTIEAWLTSQNNTGSSVWRGNDGFGTGWNMNIQISFASGSNIPSFSVVTTVPSTVQYVVTGSAYTPNTWCHVVGIWQPGVSLSVYKNGVLDGVTNTTSTTLRSSTKGWVIGRQPSTSYIVSYNSIFRVYNRVLSANEILQNFNTQKSRFGLI